MVRALVNRLGLVMRVHINGELFADCVRIARPWNGWVEPIFTREQMENIVSDCVRLGWVSSVDEMSREIVELSNGDVQILGWTWELVEEGN
jgi:hypothetical protein